MSVVVDVVEPPPSLVVAIRLFLRKKLNAISTSGFTMEVILSTPIDKGSKEVEGLISTDAAISMLRGAE